ncbi:Synaptic vesicle 2-related protein, partial [Apostichopus japonicus]
MIEVTNAYTEEGSTTLDSAAVRRPLEAIDNSFTVSDALSAIGIGPQQVVLCVAAAFSGIAVYAQVILITTIADLLRCELELTENQMAFVTSVFFLGEMLGSYPTGRLVDIYGRKPSALILTIGLWYTGILTAFAPNFAWAILLRFMSGVFAVGMINVYSVYVGEMTPSKIRMVSLLLFPLFFGLGTVYIASMGLIVVPELGWRWQAIMATIPAIITAILTLSVPESARYLVLIGELKMAWKLLRRLADRNETTIPDGDLVQAQPSEVEGNATVLSLLGKDTWQQTLSLWAVWFTSYFVYIGMALSTNYILNIQQVIIPKDVNGTGIINPDDIPPPKPKELVILPFYDECNPPPNCSLFFNGEGDIKFLIASVGDLAAIPIVFAILIVLGHRWTVGVCMALTSITCAFIIGLMRMADMTALIFVVRALSFGIYGSLFLITIEAYSTYNRSIAMATGQFLAKAAGTLAPLVAD